MSFKKFTASERAINKETPVEPSKTAPMADPADKVVGPPNKPSPEKAPAV